VGLHVGVIKALGVGQGSLGVGQGSPGVDRCEALGEGSMVPSTDSDSSASYAA
jgi:hypothetical protein